MSYQPRSASFWSDLHCTHTYSLSTVMTITNSRENKRRDALYGTASSYQGGEKGQNEQISEEKRTAQNTAWGLDGMTEDQIVALGDRHPGFRKSRSACFDCTSAELLLPRLLPVIITCILYTFSGEELLGQKSMKSGKVGQSLSKRRTTRSHSRALRLVTTTFTRV